MTESAEVHESDSLDSLQRSYSAEEVESIYELARFSAENGDLNRSEIILNGLVEVAPDYAPAFLGLSFVNLKKQAFETALEAAQRALNIDSQLVPAELYIVAASLSLGDFNTAGTLLGGVGERITSGHIQSNEVIRFYNIQLARFENRR